MGGKGGPKGGAKGASKGGKGGAKTGPTTTLNSKFQKPAAPAGGARPWAQQGAGKGEVKSQKGAGKGDGKSQKGDGKKGDGKKGAGKGKKGAGKQQEEQSSDAPRKRVTTHRVTGKLIQWKGPFGFVIPDEPINHPDAQKRKGKIYLDQVDVEKEISGVGAHVSFFVYSDANGLGASNVVPAKGPAIQKTIEKASKGKGSDKGKTGEKGKGGEKGKAKGAEKGAKDAKSSEKGKAKGAEKGAKDAKAKGKGKGKKSEKGEKTEEQGEKKEAGAPPDLTTRESLGTEMTGTIYDNRGAVFWIKMDGEIDHPDYEAKKRRNGHLYCHESDVVGELPLVNAKITFCPYSDATGFGGEMIQVTEQGDGVKPVKEKKTKGEKGEGKGKKQPLGGTFAERNAKLKKKQDKGKGKGKDKKEKGKGKGKGKKESTEPKGPSGPDLPRERVSDEAIMGEVLSWKGRIGWIVPSDPSSMPEGDKHNGKIYCHKKDLIDNETLEKGATVQFHVFKDESGLGCEEVMIV